jgi:hypothetical protein
MPQAPKGKGIFGHRASMRWDVRFGSEADIRWKKATKNAWKILKKKV